MGPIRRRFLWNCCPPSPLTLLVVFLCTSSVFLLHRISNSHSSEFDEWFDCMDMGMTQMEDANQVWTNLQSLIQFCEGIEKVKKVRFESFQNQDETKYHIISPSTFTSNIISLGVGHDIAAEEQISAKVPNISFFGADPIVEVNQELYSKIGDFFPFAVGSESGMGTASVLVSTTYLYQTVVHVEMIYFLKEIIKKKVIDNMLLDAEGAEFGLLPYFYRGGQFDQAGVTLCQINMELHKPDDENKQKFHHFVTQLLKDRRYIIVKPFQFYHLRVFLFNIDSDICLQRYIL